MTNHETQSKTGIPDESLGDKQRLNWIDQARGLTMFLLVVTGLMPSEWRKSNAVLWFFFEHPPDTAQYITLYDIGVPAFFFIIGLLMAVSLQNRSKKDGVFKAVLHAVIRWGSIFVLGLIIIVATWSEGLGEVKEIAPGLSVYVLSWDVIYGIGAVGLWSIPFLFIPNKVRFGVAYGMMIFYQIMIMIPGTYWRAYGQASIDGGIVGAFFMRTTFVLIGSCVGEYFVLDTTVKKKTKIKHLAIFGVVNLALGLGLWLVPGGYPNTAESTMGWATLSLVVITAFILLFILTDYTEEEFAHFHPINKGRIIILKAYGQNPFLVYLLAVIPEEVIGELVDDALWHNNLFRLGIWVGLTAMVTLVALLLYKKRKVISTTKIALGAIIIVIVLAIALIGTGIVSLD